ncbi:50S ribosomal protein L29 [Candidatus Woesearchaeota archaeon]|jgi:large subunit ribosomal protein L29|nr:50S ribosomal protein L29 [Candidatus Woesearchaeota archaeon]|tara:strand:- start:166 stop:351 length:186 start_codon:yes stop_codon:yes gene_type:complete
MKIKELKALSKEELKKKYQEVKLELIKLNSQAATGTNMKNPGQIKLFKKMIARIKTIQQNE